MEKQNISDRARPVEKSHLQIADTFQDAGTRPIEESSDLLMSDAKTADKSDKLGDHEIPAGNSPQLEINSIPPLD